MTGAAEPAGNLGQYLNADHPDAYTVVRGDTLWDISGRFLQKPWLWPELWQVNPQIENPHLIYPGDIIRLVCFDGQPRLQLERGGAGLASGDGRLNPSIRTTPLDSAIPTIRLDAVQSWLVQNQVVSEEELNGAPYVVQGASERLVLGAGDRVYVRGMPSASESFNFVRRLASNFFPSAPAHEVAGQIISVFSGVTQVGQFDVVVLNLGAREGMDVGILIAIYKRGALAKDRVAKQTIRLPSERAGLLMVCRVFERLSYGVVLETERPLAVNDEVKNP